MNIKYESKYKKLINLKIIENYKYGNFKIKIEKFIT